MRNNKILLKSLLIILLLLQLNNVVESCDGMLQCWLANITINIPSISVKLDSITAQVNNLTCNNIQLENINTTSLKAEGITALDINIDGIGVPCNGEFTLVTDNYTANSDMLLMISNSNLQFVYGIDTNLSDTYPIITPYIGQCTPDIIFDLSFSNSGMGELFDMILPLFKQKIDTTINQGICDGIIEFVDKNITQLVNSIQSTMGPKPNYPPQVYIYNPENIELVNWPSVPILHTLDKIINEPHGILTNASHLNCLMDKFLDSLDIVGNLWIPIYKNITLPIPNVANVTLQLNFIDINGLDEFQHLKLLHATKYNNQSISSRIALDELNITLSLGIELTPNGGIFSGKQLIENFNISLNMSHIDISADMVAAFKRIHVDQLRIGEILSKHGISCLLASMFNGNVTWLEVDLNVIDLEIIPLTKNSKILDYQLDFMINQFMKLLINDNSLWLHDAIQGVSRHFIAPISTLLIQLLIALSGTACPTYVPPNKPNYVKWNESVFWNDITKLINYDMNATGINDILECFELNNMNKHWHIHTKLMNSDATIDLKLILNGLKSFSDFMLLEAKNEDTLNTSIAFASNNYQLLNGKNMIQLTDSSNFVKSNNNHYDEDNIHIVSQQDNQLPFNLSLWLDLQYGDIHTNVELHTALKDLLLKLSTVIYFDETTLDTIQLKQLGDPHLLGFCIESFFKAINISSMALSFGDLSFAYNITGGGGGLHVHNSSSGINFTHNVNHDIKKFTKMLAQFVNDTATKLCHDAPYGCAGVPVPNTLSSNDTTVQLRLAFIVIGSVVLLMIFIWSVQKFGKVKATDDENKHLLIDSPMPPNTSAPIDWNRSLLFNQNLPFLLRVGVLISILGTIALFLWSNLSKGASVKVQLRVGDEVEDLGYLFTFSLGNTVRDMWKAHAYGLSLIVAILSGGWPYLKLLLMFFAMVLPRGVLSKTRRETLLIWLDRLGKWSLVDTFVMVMFIVAFRFHIGLLSNSVIADVFVIPQNGLYGFVLATMISVVLSHIMLGMHRHVTTKYVVPDGGKSEALCTHSHRIHHDILDPIESNTPHRVRCTKVGQILVVVFVIIAMILFAAGVYEKTFSFDFRGLAGLALGESSNRAYSVIDLGEQVPKSAENPSGFGVRWLQIVFYVLSVGFPALFLSVLLLLWILPLTLRRQRQLLVLSEVSFAWASLDVFILAIVAATLQISKFAQFIVGNRCDGINVILAAFLDGPLDGDDVCFDLIARFNDGCWLLFVAAIIIILAGQLLGDANVAAVHDRLRSHYHETTRRLSEPRDKNVKDDKDFSDSDEEESVEADKLTTKCELQCLRCRYACNLGIYRLLERMGIVELE